MDFGARKGGYCSDMTRTVFLGKPEGKLLAAWDTLRRANEECEAMVRAGVTGAAVHEHAETVLAEGGFGGAMGHSLGHSVGLDIHEFPNLAPSNDQPLPEGAVLTVEPGIYLEGEFGMRLEDYGVVRADGYEVLTKSTHEMVIIDGRY
jgi:Xaa-Pro aminopeptidase